MFIGSILLLLVIPFILLFAVGIPVIIGVCVYRDASRRVDCSPWLWALVAALVPSCIGLVVYLIIRKDYPPKDAGPRMQSGYGSDAEGCYQQSYGPQTETEHSGLPTWAKGLIIIGAVVVLIALIALIGAVLYSMFGYNHGLMTYHQGF